jgi:LytS/YehU family sensor histidine kinase
MDLIRLYLDILQIRFQDRLTVEIQLQPEALDMQVPSMILQPIVENAIQHGIASRTEGGRIGISAALVDGRLRMQVRDDGPGLPPDGLPAGDGIGLTNTRSRLEAIYGAGHRFEMSNGQSGGLTVTLEIPARCDKEAGGEDSRADRG